VKMADFENLCEREWANGRGDVRALTLTAESLRELSAEALGPEPSSFTHEGVTRTFSAAAGDRVSEAVNPVTRHACPITEGEGPDAATVACGPNGETRVVILSPA
jgi:hypothetical protein